MAKPEQNLVSDALIKLLSQTPRSGEAESASPLERSKSVARRSALRAAGVSAAFALPPGPLGIVTILPDLLAIWRIQQAMVADIAALHGRSAALSREAMIYCLFKHGGAALVRDLVVRTGERYLIRRAAGHSLQRLLEKVGIKVSQRFIGKGLARWVPLAGSVAVGAYAYYDTKKVAETAMELFSRDVETLSESVPEAARAVAM